VFRKTGAMEKTADRILSKSSLTDASDCRPAGA
jgi:hypothetical protein